EDSGPVLVLLAPPLRALLLRRVRNAIDHRVDEPASTALDLRDVDRRDHLLIAIEADRPPRRLDLRYDAPQRIADLDAITHFAPHGVDRRGDELSGHVASLAVGAGPSVVPGVVVAH